jgi:hypothetical protein
MLASTLALMLLAADPEPADTVVVAPKGFLAALNPLIVHRHAQGHRFGYIPNTNSPEEIRASIRETAKNGKLAAVLLVGDAEPAAVDNPRVRARCVPVHRAEARVIVRFGSEPEIASDNWYADLDDDELPDLAIGRLPADSPQELSEMVGKIIRYETRLDHGPWRQRVNLVAGVGGFGSLADSVIETAAKKLLTDGIPPTYHTTMTFGSWRSPFCPDPRRFHDTTVARINEGCLFWVYMGHGQATELDRVSVPGGQFPIFQCDDCVKLQAHKAPPVAIMLACYTAAFDRREDCLAEEMLRADGGPVAVFGGSRVTMPYAMAVMGSEMIREHFQHRPATLGEVIKNAKRRMALPPDEKEPLKNANRLLLDSLASVLSPARNMLDQERREHLHLFNLIGDPNLRLSHPRDLKVEVVGDAIPGDEVRIKAGLPVAGRMILELVCRRDVLKADLPARERFDPSNAGLASLQETYLRANDSVWSRRELELRSLPPEEEPLSLSLPVPKEARGAAHVRVFIQGERDYAAGAASVFIRKPAAKEPVADRK